MAEPMTFTPIIGEDGEVRVSSLDIVAALALPPKFFISRAEQIEPYYTKLSGRKFVSRVTTNKHGKETLEFLLTLRDCVCLTHGLKDLERVRIASAWPDVPDTTTN